MLRLYTSPIRTNAQRRSGATLEQQLALEGALDEDLSIARQQGSDPSEQTVSWYYRGERAGLMAAEVEELAEASGIDAVPLYDDSGESSAAGYYAVESADISRVAPQSDRAWEITATLRQEGRRGSHRRAIDTTVVQVDNPFGTDQTASVAVPDAAEGRRWYDGAGQTAPVTSSDELEFRRGEFADWTLLDADAAPYDDPAVVFDLAYSEEMRASPVLWDTLGNASRDDSDGNRQWMHAFSGSHTPEGRLVFSTGAFRLYVDPSASSASDQLEAEEWDDANSQWSAISMGSSVGTWTLREVDVTRAADDRLAAQFLFYDTDAEETFALDAQVGMGRGRVLWSIPDGESGPIDSDLDTWLTPVSRGNVYDVQPTLDVVPRRDLRS